MGRPGVHDINLEPEDDPHIVAKKELARIGKGNAIINKIKVKRDGK